jgi:hypothetical protein
MATLAEKEALVAMLKFTPVTYKIEIYGYGGEICMGRVSRASYDYFQENDLSLDEYAGDWDNELEVPEEFQPFAPGEWSDCDDIAHESGATVDDCSRVVVYDEAGQQVWERSLSDSELYESEILECAGETYVSERLQPGEVCVMTESTEKGEFFAGDIHLTEPFDPSKLKLWYNDVEGWEMCSAVTYADEDIINDGGGTTGKGFECRFIVNED